MAGRAWRDNVTGKTALQEAKLRSQAKPVFKEARLRQFVEAADWLQKHESSETALLTLLAEEGEETAAQGGGTGTGSSKNQKEEEEQKRGSGGAGVRREGRREEREGDSGGSTAGGELFAGQHCQRWRK
mgnify:CR=1 FL=1